MRESATTLHLTPSQVAQLLGYCATYRAYLWQCLLPTPARNQTIRGIQLVQGRLDKAQEQGGQVAMVACTGAEGQTIRQLLGGLTRTYGQAPPSERRTQELGELFAFRRQIASTPSMNVTKIVENDISHVNKGNG